MSANLLQQLSETQRQLRAKTVEANANYLRVQHLERQLEMAKANELAMHRRITELTLIRTPA